MYSVKSSLTILTAECLKLNVIKAVFTYSTVAKPYYIRPFKAVFSVK